MDAVGVDEMVVDLIEVVARDEISFDKVELVTLFQKISNSRRVHASNSLNRKLARQ